MTRILLAIAVGIPLAVGLYVVTRTDSPKPQPGEPTVNQPVAEKKAYVEITADNFEELVTNSTQPVVVDFWASWCQPCMMLGPHVEEIAKEYDGKAIVGKVNVDQQPELSKKFKANSIPLVVIFKDGEVVQRMQEDSFKMPDMIRSTVDQLLEPDATP